MDQATLVITESDLVFREDKTQLTHDAQGRAYRVKRLPRPQIQGEVLRSILARAVGIGSPRVSVLVNERLEPIGIVAPVLELNKPIDIKHPELLRAISVKGILGDGDLLEAETLFQNLATDPAGKLWVLDFEGSMPARVSGWYEGNPEILASLYALIIYSHFHFEHLPLTVESWRQAAQTGLDAFDGPGLRLLGDVRLLNQSLEKLVENMCKIFLEEPMPTHSPARPLA
ncbi:hypothetical protein [Meiothermus sp.]|uniref:hypothetical protein n=1 Tax=Meiothermus sp. TaxID=1955249 RepID=UPI0021DC9741|nr:hypothetical protein [Meiothermus sp.]GIW25897.1 MAG: hypothetical protein KatS3mg069_2164 [Meiothermus sp.]